MATIINRNTSTATKTTATSVSLVGKDADGDICIGLNLTSSMVKKADILLKKLNSHSVVSQVVPNSGKGISKFVLQSKSGIDLAWINLTKYRTEEYDPTIDELFSYSWSKIADIADDDI